MTSITRPTLDDVARKRRMMALSALMEEQPEKAADAGINLDLNDEPYGPVGEEPRQPLVRREKPEPLPVNLMFSAPRNSGPGAPVAPIPYSAPRAAPSDEDAARAADADSRMRRAIEVAGRQMVEGLSTRKYTGPILSEVTDEVGELRGRKDRARAEALRALELGNGEERNRIQADEVARRGLQDSERSRLTADRLELDKARAELDAKFKEWAMSPDNPKNKPKKGSGAAPKKDEGKTLPASTVEGLAALPVAEQQVDNLVETFKRLDMGSTMSKISGRATDIFDLQGTDAAEYAAQARIAMQAAGTILEGGKLAAGDEVKYKAMLPRPGDSESVVGLKAKSLKGFLRSLADARSKGLKESGYNVPSELMAGDGAPAQASGGLVILVDKDGTEYAFAPDRVAAILKARPDLKKKE